jgi:hypothetical protein
MNEHEESLKVIDTKDSLTVDELQELKKLAAMSKTARTVIAVVIGAIMLIGGDKLIDIIQAHGQVTH